MESSTRALLVFLLLAAIATQYAAFPAMATCGDGKSCRGGGGYYAPRPKPPARKPPCPSPKPPSPSPCSKSSPPCKGSKSSSTRAQVPPRPSTPDPTPPARTSPPAAPSSILPPVLLPPNTPWPFGNHPFTGSVDFWKSNQQMIQNIIAFWGAIGNMFGAPPITSLFGGGIPSIPQALFNSRTDGYGALLREGAASILNSIANRSSFPFSTSQVQRSFYGALNSEASAAAQAAIFKAANENRFH